MKYLIGGLLGVLAFFIVGFIINFIKAAKDEDVRDASKLHMPIGRFKLYKEKFEEQCRYVREGKEPPFFDAPYPDEWIRFGKYMFRKDQEKREQEFEKWRKNLENMSGR